ncbi:MAG: tetratricopeptide repeat protein [Treponema sp.]
MKVKIKALFFIICVIFFASCNNKRFIQRVQEYEEGVNNPTSEAELNDAIKKYLRRIDDIIVASERVGTWYKILGTRYLDKKMYKNAFECFQKSIEFYPENQNLYYKVGVCAALMAKNSIEYEDMEDHYFNIAVKAYKRAIEIDPNYSKAIYALSVLYIFELGEPKEAIPLLEKAIDGKMKPLEELFLLGRAYAMVGENEKAISTFKRIVDISGNEAQRKQAKENIDIILMNSNKK